MSDEQGTVTFNVTVRPTPAPATRPACRWKTAFLRATLTPTPWSTGKATALPKPSTCPRASHANLAFRPRRARPIPTATPPPSGEFTDEFGETRTPDLSAEACFEVISPDLNIIKDFVDANGESLGDNVTVNAGEEAILRVRVVNRGSGVAENLTVTDALTSGDAESYSLVALPEGANQSSDTDFSAEFESVGVNEAATLTYTVTGDADGEYCDTASYTVDGEEGGEDQACLTVATPELTVEKTNSEDTVLPGNTYTSTITVTNTGNAVAEDVLVSDVVGTNTEGDVTLVYVSSEVENEAGAFDEETGTVESGAAVNLAPEDTVVLNVTTRVPEGIAANQFCDVGRYTSANAGEGEVEACVDVPAFAALQTRMIDDPDPSPAGSEVTYTSTIYIEERSNESVTDNQLTFTFGSQGDGAGTFEITDAQVFVTSNPQRNQETGLVTAAPSSGDALTLDEDFTVSSDATGQQTVTLNNDLEPNTAVFFVHTVTVPEGTSAGSYGSSYDWSATGVDSGTQYNPQNSEPTTVIGQ